MESFDLVPDDRKNVGGSDRIARFGLVLVLFAIAVVAAMGSNLVVTVLAMLGSAGFFLNAATQFCGVNALLGLDTCSRADGDC